MKASKIRVRTIHNPSKVLLSKMTGAHLSKELREKHHMRGIRVVPGDVVLITRGIYRGISGKVERVVPAKGVVVAGTKQEKSGGEKYDVFVHHSNLLITQLNASDKQRASKLKITTRDNSETKNNQGSDQEQ